MLVGRPVNTDRTKREIFEPHGYFRTLELVRPSFAHNPTRFRKRKYRPSSRGIKQVPGSRCRATGRRFVDYMKDVCPRPSASCSNGSPRGKPSQTPSKIPRFTFEKFPQADPTLTTQMKSVGEAMAIGRTFKEDFQKAIRSLEIGRFGFGADGKNREPRLENGDWNVEEIQRQLLNPSWNRIFFIRYALLAGFSVARIKELTGIDPWFLENLRTLVVAESDIRSKTLSLRAAKRLGFSDRQIANLSGRTEAEVRKERHATSILPTYRLVDTCAAEFEAYTPYYYSTYGEENEIRESDRRRVMILGGGPNRIGQGIEFDYCCVHASFAL